MTWKSDPNTDWIRTIGRYIPDRLAKAAVDNDGDQRDHVQRQMALQEHHTVAMYLIGVFAMLEGCYGEPSWKQQLKPLNGLCKMPASDYSTTDFDLLWHVRDAAVHGMTKQNGNPRFPTTKREELQTWAGIEISTTSNGEQVWLTTPLLKRVRSSSSNSPTRTRVGVRSPPSRRWPNLAVAEARE